MLSKVIRIKLLTSPTRKEGGREREKDGRTDGSIKAVHQRKLELHGPLFTMPLVAAVEETGRNWGCEELPAYW